MAKIARISNRDSLQIAQIQQAMATERQPFAISFTQASLNINNTLPVLHNLNIYPSSVVVLDATNEEIQPDDISYANQNAIAIDLSSFVPIQGQWQVLISE